MVFSIHPRSNPLTAVGPTRPYVEASEKTRGVKGETLPVEEQTAASYRRNTMKRTQIFKQNRVKQKDRGKALITRGSTNVSPFRALFLRQGLQSLISSNQHRRETLQSGLISQKRSFSNG